MEPRRVLLVVTGGIAAYKTLELVRRLVERDIAVTPILTEAGAAFVTPLSLAALAGIAGLRVTAHGLAGAAMHECSLAFGSLPPSRDRQFVEGLSTWVFERT